MRLVPSAGHGRLASLMMLLAALAFWPLEAGSAQCVAPYLQLGGDNRRPVLTSGSSVTVEGRAFVEGCNDTGSCQETLGCSSCTYEEEEIPHTDVELTLRQGSRSWTLGALDAGIAADNELGQITWDLVVPSDSRPGPAVLIADSARLEVTVKR